MQKTIKCSLDSVCKIVTHIFTSKITTSTKTALTNRHDILV